jgi:outer membrane protein OmpA-like peptidoglycan-associated protein
LASVSTVPIGLNYLKTLPNPDHYLEGGVGATMIWGQIFGLGGAGTAVGNAYVGYRYQPVSGGFNFRIGVSSIIAEDAFVPLPEISMGATFGGIRRAFQRKAPVMKPKPAEPIIVKKPDDEFVKVGDEAYHLDNVYFDQGEAKLLPDSYTQLDKLASMLKNSPKMTIRVEGHTENIGDPAANVKLSEDRANAVRDYLKNRGILGSRINVKGYGSSKPISTENTIEGRRQNRRVTFVILNQ